MKKSRLVHAVYALILGLCSITSANATNVWFGEDYRRIVDPSGNYVGQFFIPGSASNTLWGGMTTVGNEIWVGYLDSSTVLRVDFSGNILGNLPAFTTEGTGGMTTVGNEVWWGSADSTTILRLDFAGNVVGTVDNPDGLRSEPTGGMATIGNEVWWGPAGNSFFGGVLWRFDTAGNWLGSLADPVPGLIQQPVSGEPTAGMTTVGDEVWWAEVGPFVTSITSQIYRMDSSGNVLGSFCISNPSGCGPYSSNFGGMTIFPTPPTLVGILPATPGGLDFQAYYDELLDITWAADANLNGLDDWNDHAAWIAGLTIGNVSGWRLPSMDRNGDGTVVDCQGGGVIGCADNEMGFLFWEEGITTATPGPFSNIETVYWSGTDVNPNAAYTFNFSGGAQSFWAKTTDGFFAWPVHDGDARLFIDSDGDGVVDLSDNCTEASNPGQLDTDGDDIGNECDCDFNQDNFCGGPDFTQFIGCFNASTGDDPTCEATDMNGDNFVGGPDFTLFIGGFNGPPGPSGLLP